MRGSLALRVAWLPVAWVAAAGLTALAQDTPTLAPGGNFDGPQTAGGLPTGWYRYGQAGSTHRETVVEGGRTGNCIRVEGAGSYAGVASAKVPLDPTARYAARAWARPAADTTGGAYLKVDFFDATGKYVGDSKVKPTVKTAGEAWQYLSLVVPGNLHAEATQIAVAVGVNQATVACFDDVELVRREGETNLLADGGFELVAGESPTGWGLSQPPGGTIRRVRRSVPVREGWSSMQLVGRAAWTSSDAGTSLPLDRAKRYTLTGWARARLGKARIKINYMKDGMWLGHTTSPDAAGNQWQQLTVIGEPDKFPEATRISAGANCSGPDVDALFDGFVLKAE
jgi:hypothetical protein